MQLPLLVCPSAELLSKQVRQELGQRLGLQLVLQGLLQGLQELQELQLVLHPLAAWLQSWLA